MNLLVIISLAVCSFCIAEKLVDYRVGLAASCTPRQCTSPGPLCETCSSLVGCVEDGDTGNYTKTILGTCKAPSYCIDGACTTDTKDPFCLGATDLPFTCSSVGVFPDPFYHKRFIFCYKDSSSTLKSIVNVCEDEYTFHIADDLCSETVANAECPHDPYPVPLCDSPGQTGAIPEKPSMFYICRERNTTLYPYLSLCPGGQEYQGYQCGDSGSNITTLPTTTG